VPGRGLVWVHVGVEGVGLGVEGVGLVVEGVGLVVEGVGLAAACETAFCSSSSVMLHVMLTDGFPGAAVRSGAQCLFWLLSVHTPVCK